MKVSILLLYSFSCLGSLFSQGFHSPGQEGIHTLHVIPIAYVKLNHNYLACIPRINARKLREHAVISENRSHVRVQKRKVHDKRQSQIEKKFTLAWLDWKAILIDGKICLATGKKFVSFLSKYTEKYN